MTRLLRRAFGTAAVHRQAAASFPPGADGREVGGSAPDQHHHSSDRVYLAVPYSEKDFAKAYGARWDPVRSLWWIERRAIALKPGVHRWITHAGLAAAAREAETFLAKPQSPKPRTVDQVSRRGEGVCMVETTTEYSLPLCSCPAAPWDHCPHTLAVGPSSHS